MADLHFGEQGREILTNWWQSQSTTDADRERVSEVFDTIKAGTWEARWYTVPDGADRRFITFLPDDRLYLLFRKWGDSFEFMAIGEVEESFDDED